MPSLGCAAADDTSGSWRRCRFLTPTPVLLLLLVLMILALGASETEARVVNTDFLKYHPPTGFQAYTRDCVRNFMSKARQARREEVAQLRDHVRRLIGFRLDCVREAIRQRITMQRTTRLRTQSARTRSSRRRTATSYSASRAWSRTRRARASPSSACH